VIITRRFIYCFFLTYLTAVSALGAELQEDLKTRRARAMERLGPDSMLILWSAPVKVYSNDVDYEFRQDSNFYYLTGIDQPETILVLMPGNQERKEILFVSPADPVREHWNGHLLSPREATDQSGIATVYTINEFEPFLSAVLSRRAYGPGANSQEYAQFFNALSENRARLQVLLGPAPKLNEPLPERYDFLRKLQERFFGFAAIDATNIFRDLRVTKTPYEQKIMEQSAEISNEAHMAGMKAAHPGAWEYEVEAAVEYVFKKRGAFDWGYPSIVGSGPNATILHYEKSSRQMKDGELLLVDAAANYRYITVDITRTYPVNGKFTPEQKDIYNLVLKAQEEGMKVAKPGAKLNDINQKTVEIIKDGLLKLGLITDTSGDQYRTWYTHNANHWIGMDVHDIGDSTRPLAPGMAFVIEPGIYIRESALENLPKTPENAAFIEKVRPAVRKYKDIGVRIEDSFLLTENGLKRLSDKVPRTVDEIESFMKSR
jgi:Xaa-Pro aminopeptidase